MTTELKLWLEKALGACASEEGELISRGTNNVLQYS